MRQILPKNKLNVRQEITVKKERKLDRFLSHGIEIGEVQFQIVDLLFIVCLFIAGLLIRLPLYPITSGDYQGFCSHGWMKSSKKEAFFP